MSDKPTYGTDEAANLMREKMIMGAAKDMQDQLLEYTDQAILKAFTRRIKIKITIE